MKVSDITLKLHEELRTLDAAWLKKLLVSLVGETKEFLHDSLTLYIQNKNVILVLDETSLSTLVQVVFSSILMSTTILKISIFTTANTFLLRSTIGKFYRTRYIHE